MIKAADLAERAPLLALLDSAERAWRVADLVAAAPTLEAGRVAGLLVELEGLGYVERRVGEALDVYRLSPLGRRTLHHWVETEQWRLSGGS